MGSNTTTSSSSSRFSTKTADHLHDATTNKHNLDSLTRFTSHSTANSRESGGTGRNYNTAASETNSCTSKPYNNAGSGGSSTNSEISSTPSEFKSQINSIRSKYHLRNPTGSQYPQYGPTTNFTSVSFKEDPGSKKISWRDRLKDTIADKAEEPTSWMSRGVCTDDILKENKNSQLTTEKSISADETPSVNPRKFNGVTKIKGVQTDKETVKLLDLNTASKYLSSIPRPAIAKSYYSPFSAAISRFTAANKKDETNDEMGVNKDEESGSSNNTSRKNSNASSVTGTKERKTSNPHVTTTKGNDSQLEDNQSRSSITNKKLVTTVNCHSVRKKSGSSSGSNPSSLNGSTTNINEQSPTLDNNKIGSISKSGSKTKLKSGMKIQGTSVSTLNSTANTMLNGVKVTLVNKEFRKSALNVNLMSEEQQAEFMKKQEQLRGNLLSLNANHNEGSKIVISSVKKRPPTDPKKMGSQSNLAKSSSRSNNSSLKLKSSKTNIAQLRRSSCSSESSECSSTSSSSLSATSHSQKKHGGPSGLPKRSSCSSSSSRSSSAERSRAATDENYKRPPNLPKLSANKSSQKLAPQTSFYTRNAEDKPYLRKCESGNVPWWLASTPDVPGQLKKCGSKKENIQGGEIDFPVTVERNIAMEDRTSPDGGEVPTCTMDRLSKMLDTQCSLKSGAGSQLFISNVNNIDEILGSMSPTVLSPEPTASFTISLKPRQSLGSVHGKNNECEKSVGADDGEESDSSDSSEEDIGKGNIDAILCDDEDDDTNSIDTSSSFEEVNPATLMENSTVLPPDYPCLAAAESFG